MMSPESRLTLFGIVLQPAALFFSVLPGPEAEFARKAHRLFGHSRRVYLSP
ncbi:hypothetical protein [Mesorhizobium sp. ORM8.1]